ncbi:hypothetical protein [Pseudomonas sp. RIT-To-2]|uniref:hypothetical protein n=1 Tax=Pseudomonas sp. RIT-To-2 TaxID=3462541 RepID=UPI0024138ACB
MIKQSDAVVFKLFDPITLLALSPAPSPNNSGVFRWKDSETDYTSARAVTAYSEEATPTQSYWQMAGSLGNIFDNTLFSIIFRIQSNTYNLVLHDTLQSGNPILDMHLLRSLPPGSDIPLVQIYDASGEVTVNIDTAKNRFEGQFIFRVPTERIDFTGAFSLSLFPGPNDRLTHS